MGCLHRPLIGHYDGGAVLAQLLAHAVHVLSRRRVRHGVSTGADFPLSAACYCH